MKNKLTIKQVLQKGIEAHKAGKDKDAARYYSAILKVQPNHPDANHNLGVLNVGLGKTNEALPLFKRALEINPNIEQFWVSYVDAFLNLDKFTEANQIFSEAVKIGFRSDMLNLLEKRLNSAAKPNTNTEQSIKVSLVPSKDQLKSLVTLYSNGQYNKALDNVKRLLKEFPNSPTILNIYGAIKAGLGHYDEAIEAYKKAISIKPDFTQAYNNMGIALQDKQMLEDAENVYKKALSINSNNASLHTNLGNVLNEQGKVNEAIRAYEKSLSLNPKSAETLNNLASALLDNNKPDAAVKAYEKAILLKPEYADAHRNLSSVKRYTKNDEQFIQVKKLIATEGKSKDYLCSLSFTLAKMYQDTGDLSHAFKHLCVGNALRKELLGYTIAEDIKLFSQLKKTQPTIEPIKTKQKRKLDSIAPIFIVGMPRSGTTLVEQIVSSHSQVMGAGELPYISNFGSNLAIGSTLPNKNNILNFRKRYLEKIINLPEDNIYISDKMPQNFRFIPLICAAFPEAKIIHVQRSAAATCWSNYKQYFVADGTGYCYDLHDVVSYYKLYNDLMNFWEVDYNDRIYNLNYENLTSDQENQTRKLIDHLELTWEDACLSPQMNNRSVRTASKQQVRQKIYKGSSEEWRKYELYLNGAFDSLPSS